jgi:hypothetical protein
VTEAPRRSARLNEEWEHRLYAERDLTAIEEES